MKLTLRTQAVPAVASAVVTAFLIAPAARGGLIAAVAYNQLLGAGTALSGDATPATLVGTTLPVRQTNAVVEPIGTPAGFGNGYASGMATYAFTDDGTTAALRINCQGQLNYADSTVGQGTVGASITSPIVEAGTYLTFAVPVAFTASIAATAPPNAGSAAESNAIVSLVLDDPPAGRRVGYAFVDTVNGPTQSQAAGIVPAGERLYVSDSWKLYNGTAYNVPVETGTYSLAITFTAVPEPASAVGVAAAAGAAALTRRRRC